MTVFTEADLFPIVTTERAFISTSTPFALKTGFNIVSIKESRVITSTTFSFLYLLIIGEIVSAECVKSEGCKRESTCATRIIWEKIDKSINDVIDNITLKDMIDDHNKIAMEDK